MSRIRNLRRLGLEALEDRRLLATLTVSSLADAGSGSLREAIVMANGNDETDTILFSVAGTINLDSQLPTITEGLGIDGGQQVTLDAGDGTDGIFNTGDGFRIFDIDDNNNSTRSDVALRGLTLTGGDTANGVSGNATQDGGAIRSFENLTLVDSVDTGNATGKGGNHPSGFGGRGGRGGVFSYGLLALVRTGVNGIVAGRGGDGVAISAERTGGRGGSGGGIWSDGTHHADAEHCNREPCRRRWHRKQRRLCPGWWRRWIRRRWRGDLELWLGYPDTDRWYRIRKQCRRWWSRRKRWQY